MTYQVVLNQYYSGRLTNEQLIEPGTYDVGDPRLYGLEDYLVNVQGIARFIGEPPPPEPTTPPDDETQGDQEPADENSRPPTDDQTPAEQTDDTSGEADSGETSEAAEQGSGTNPEEPTEPVEPPATQVPMPPYEDLSREILRGLVAQRGLTDKVVPTGKNGAVKNDDYIRALKDTGQAG